MNVKKAIRQDGFFFVFLYWLIIMGRIIGIDYGKKRIGLAVTDPLADICITAEYC